MVGGRHKRNKITDRDALAALLGEELLRAVEERGLQLTVEVEASGPGVAVNAAVADLKDALAERRSAEAEAQKLMALGELGAGVVHEVRNLVTSIRGFAQVARRKVDGQGDVDGALATIENESARCVDALSSFLGFARKRSAEFGPLHINDVVELAAKLVRHQLAINNVNLELQLMDDAPVIDGNRDAIVQVLVNLALNAQQAMPDGGEVRIATRTDRAGAAEIAVADTGPGVPADLRDRIFDPFFTTKPRGKGTGLGLAISARIADEHGGSLELGSSGAGARFVLRLPGRTR